MDGLCKVVLWIDLYDVVIVEFLSIDFDLFFNVNIFEDFDVVCMIYEVMV